jgi:hypothetical protein
MTTYTAAQVVAAAQAGTPITGATILDSAADIQASIDSLQPLAAAGDIAAISFTDASSPTLMVSVAQNSSDAAAIGLFQGQRSASRPSSAPMSRSQPRLPPAPRIG